MGTDEMVMLIGRLAQYASARDRVTEREPRTITITDDEAIMILDAIEHHYLANGEPS